MAALPFALCAGKFYCPRMASMNKPCYAAIQVRVLFVAGRAVPTPCLGAPCHTPLGPTAPGRATLVASVPALGCHTDGAGRPLCAGLTIPRGRAAAKQRHKQCGAHLTSLRALSVCVRACVCAPLTLQMHSPTKPVLVFVSSRRQTRLTALDLITFAGEIRSLPHARINPNHNPSVQPSTRDGHCSGLRR